MKTKADEYFDAANLAELHGHYADANALYDKVLDLEPKYPVHHNRAVNWTHLKQYDKAIADYQIAISNSPDCPYVHEYLAEVYLSAEDSSYHNTDLAFHHACKACELSQFSIHSPISILAKAHAAKREYAKAISLQKKAMQVASKELEADYWIMNHKKTLMGYQQKFKEHRRDNGWFSWLFK